MKTTIYLILLAACTVIALNIIPHPSNAQNVSAIQITQRTANVQYAGTNDGFSLVIRTPGRTCSFDFPNLPHNERERGVTDVYNINVSSCAIDRSYVTSSTVFIRTKGTNAWLPSSFKLIGTAGGVNFTITDRSWPSSNWFSRDSDDWSSSTNVVKSEWAVGAGAETDAPAPSTITITVRHLQVSTVGAPACRGSVTVSGTLINAATGATTGSTSFSHSLTWTGYASPDGGTQYHCDISKLVTNLRAGSWRFAYQVPGGASSTCNLSIPLPSSALARVNFTNLRSGCATGNSFP